MSLLSATQGSPERVWSLTQALAAYDGVLARSQASLWLNPLFVKDGAPTKDQSAAFKQTISAATSLGVIESADGADRLLWPAQTYIEFADTVHDHLASLKSDNPDFLLLDMFAWLVLALERDPLFRIERDSVAETSNIDRGVGHSTREIDADADERELRFNPTKFPYWRGWMEFLGLGYDLAESGGARFFAHVSERLARTLARADLPQAKKIPADQVLATIAKAMPYMDGGALFKPLAERMQVALPARTLSGVLSRALTELREQDFIAFDRPGDAGGLIHLQVSGRDNAFQSLILKSKAP